MRRHEQRRGRLSRSEPDDRLHRRFDNDQRTACSSASCVARCRSRNTRPGQGRPQGESQLFFQRDGRAMNQCCESEHRQTPGQSAESSTAAASARERYQTRPSNLCGPGQAFSDARKIVWKVRHRLSRGPPRLGVPAPGQAPINGVAVADRPHSNLATRPSL
jgi:hypothetical protein